MNENGTKKREWVKNAAIVFLTILLILTFFSNTIQNYSLPEVATQYVESGSITAKIRGMGVVESGDPYSVKIDQSEVREVTSVEVRVGDKVEKGQVICYLVEGDSKPLEEARKALKDKQDALDRAQNAFEQALLTSNYDVSVIQGAGNTADVSTYLKQIYAAENAVNVAEQEVKSAEAKVAEWDQKIRDLENQIAISQHSSADVTNETKAVNEIQSNLTYAQNWLKTVEAQIAQEEDRLKTVSGGDASVLNSLKAQRLEANQTVINLESQLRNAKAALDAKKATVNTEATLNNLNQQLAAARADRAKASDVQTQKEEVLAINKNNRDELIANISATYNLGGLRDAITDAQEEVSLAQSEVDKLAVKNMSNEVTAPISGTITALNVKSGNEVSSDGVVATMQPEGKGYTMSFTVTNQQATRLSVGDPAELVNAWRYDDIQVTLASIKPDPNNPGQNKLLTFDVTGESVIAGQNLNVSVGQKSANYDMTVPNSAIREDSNGKFILVINSKSSPIGTRYFASRVDVEVLASDDTRSAISGGIEYYAYVITTSTKPVEAGKQVRLSNN